MIRKKYAPNLKYTLDEKKFYRKYKANIDEISEDESRIVFSLKGKTEYFGYILPKQVKVLGHKWNETDKHKTYLTRQEFNQLIAKKHRELYIVEEIEND